MEFVKIASTKDLGLNMMIGVKAGGKNILIVNVEGKYYAIENRCTHAGCALSDGTLTGETVRCPCHMSVFNVKTGNVVKGPASKAEPTFQVKTEGDQILVNV